MRKLSLFILVAMIVNSINILSKPAIQAENSKEVKSFAVVTYVSDNVQERSTRAFIKSVRELAGNYSDSKIYIVLGDPENFPCESLKSENVILIPLEMDQAFYNYPLAFKAFAAAQVEKIVAGKVSTLAWFDPATLVLGSLDELDLGNRYRVSIRPVSLLNTIGIKPGEEPNDYWTPIYTELGINYKEVPVYETIVDEQPIQAYFNCEIFSVDPRLGVFGEWADVLSNFLKNEAYQENVCNTFPRRLFLHQAVLSAVIISKVPTDKIKPLSIKNGYPFNQHERLSETKKIKSLNELSAIIFDYIWDRDANWMDTIPAAEPLKDWLMDAYVDYLKMSDNLYRMEGSCNSYLVTTSEGSVLIDPAGAASAPEYFKRILDQHPLKAVLLTHAHRDHWDHMDVWQLGDDVQIIANREFMEYIAYHNRLAPFFERRAAIWGRKPIPDPVDAEDWNPPLPTITFADEYTYELGGCHFKLTHTPGETPDHSTIWIPELGAVFIGDNYYEYFINNATLRGTSTRPVLGYIHALTLALSYQPDYFLTGHGSPVVSKTIVKETVTNFRDMLQYLYDETIEGINEGKDVTTLMQEIKVPDRFRIRPYFGKVEWTVRGIYHENVGWFDENPASMYAVPPSSIYPDFVEVAGVDAILKRAEKYLADKEYVKVLHLTDVVLESDSGNLKANKIQLEALESLKSGTRHYIERIWLDYGINSITKVLNVDN